MQKSRDNWPAGVCEHLSYPEISVFELLRSSARKWPGRSALMFAGMEMTYGELDQLSDRFAAALAGLGVRKGDRVALHLPNCPQFAIAVFGLLKTGAAFVPVSPLLSKRELAYQVNDSGAGTYIGFDTFYATAEPVLANTLVENRILVSIADCFPPVTAPAKKFVRQRFPRGTKDFTELLWSYPPEPPAVDLDVREDLAQIAYTVGTTGAPKGVMLTHFNLVANTLQIGQWVHGGDVTYEHGSLGIKRQPNDKESDHILRVASEFTLVAAPMFHAACFESGFLVQIAYGQTMSVLNRLNPAEFLQSIPKYRATAFGGAPPMFAALAEHPTFGDVDMSSLKFVMTSCESLPEYLVVTLLEKIGGVLCEAYGLTEASSITHANPASRNGMRLGSVGLPLPDTEAKIVDPEDHRKELAPGELGEVCIRGPQVMKGYWNRPHDTARHLKGGWLLTCDIGRIDEEGYLYVMDRKQDVLVSEGRKVYPRDLEAVLNAHPGVALSAVVGKKHGSGDTPIAFVRVAGEGGSVTGDELMHYANARLSSYQRIGAVIVVADLPVTITGGVLRRELKERAQALNVEKRSASRGALG